MPEKPYDHQRNRAEVARALERGSQRSTSRSQIARKPKYYVLEMLPYPSGTLHVGHVRNYSIGDALARYKWMRGFNVLHPMGWDAFGLPAENAAIKNNRHPREWTLANIAAMKRQHNRMGFSYDWDLRSLHLRARILPLEPVVLPAMLERGIAYRKKALVNWCPECATVLANEQVVDGCCWRHETTPVEQRELEQWFLRITAYADELLDDIEQARRRLAGARAHDAAQLDRPLGRRRGRFHARRPDEKIRVFTTRIDTIYGATCVILAPEHPLVRTAVDAELKRAASRR